MSQQGKREVSNREQPADVPVKPMGSIDVIVHVVWSDGGEEWRPGLLSVWSHRRCAVSPAAQTLSVALALPIPRRLEHRLHRLFDPFPQRDDVFDLRAGQRLAGVPGCRFDGHGDPELHGRDRTGAYGVP